MHLPPNYQQFVSQLAEAIRQAATGQQSWQTYVPIVSVAIAGLSAAIAALSALFSIRGTRSLAREARGHKLLPVIVFYRRSELVWLLENVGEGTALHVLVRNYNQGEQLQDEVELYPVVPREKIKLDYLRGADKLIAAYVNIFGQDPHYTTCSKDVNVVQSGKLKEQTPLLKGHESEGETWRVTRLG
jgi:hypothetical protein